MTDKEKTIRITQVRGDFVTSVDDSVVVEEPLEIRLVAGPIEKRKGRGLSITMRTPGHDFELAIGFLVSEGIVQTAAQIQSTEFCGTVADGEETSNIVRIELAPETSFDVQKLQRHFYTTSSCGVCGKASLEALETQEFQAIQSDLKVKRAKIVELPELLRDQQDVFSRTGGIHAAGLFDADGNLVSIREDVGRHNALDKLIGEQLLQDRLPLENHVLAVSGRASFELLQKTLAAGIPIFVAVGAPSSLAVELAQQFKITLIGFASRDKFNIYTHPDRITD